MLSLNHIVYSDVESSEIHQWLATCSRLSDSNLDDNTILEMLNRHLASRTTLLGTKPSKVDTELYSILTSRAKQWTPQQKTGEHGYHHILRHLDFVQNSAIFGLSVKDDEKIRIDLDEILYFKPPIDAKAEKERLKKEKAATNPGCDQAVLADRTAERGKANQKSEAKGIAQIMSETVTGSKDTVVAAVTGDSSTQQIKEKVPKAQKAPTGTSSLSPSLIDLRVGCILKAVKHPEADSLYVSTIAMGDVSGTADTTLHDGQVVRTVCSGLNGLVPLEEMQGRKVIVVANLKPVKMRGVKSCAMVLAASPRSGEGRDNHAGPVELVAPPVEAQVGQRVFFEGWKGEPERVLNPKKKIWETIQPGFTTTSELEVAFDAAFVKDLIRADGQTKVDVGRLVTEFGGVCTVQSLKDALVR